MDNIAKDYYTTIDVNNSINRYFDGLSLVVVSANQLASWKLTPFQLPVCITMTTWKYVVSQMMR